MERPDEGAGAADDRLNGHRRHLGRGFNWLGGATIIARVVDFATILVVLLFLTKQQVGIAALVISIGMVIEAFDGLGTGEALVQARSVSRLQRDSLFWFILAAAVLVAGLTLLAAPLIALIYGIPGAATYFIALAVKQPLVGAALIPLAMMNRALQYERIAMVNLGATLATALTRLGLAIAGAGAWALVGGYAASGLFILIGAMLAHPFRPRLRFRFAAIRKLLRFGSRAAATDVFEQMFKNVDYLLVGWFYGASALAVYRVAFDIAMEPAMAVGTLVNRTALPVFARISAAQEDSGGEDRRRNEMAAALIWSLRRLTILIAPLTVVLILIAGPLTALLHDQHGHSYAAAALPLKLLAAAGLLRVTSQLLYPVLLGSGQPGKAARLAAATLLLLTLGILAVGLALPARTGLIAVSAVWLGIYPILLVWGALYLRHQWGIPVLTLARACLAPFSAAASRLATALRLARPGVFAKRGVLSKRQRFLAGEPAFRDNAAMRTFARGRAWSGRSYDLGRMTLPELWRAYATYPAIQLYVVLALAAAGGAVATATRWAPVALAVLVVCLAYPVVWYLLHRFVLHGRWLYKIRWTAALWKRVHFDHHQDPHRLEVLFGAPGNTLPTIAIVTLPLGGAIGGWPAAAAALAAGLATTCVYEFVHCIQHLNYKPKSRIVLRLKQRHLAHHFHDETGNYGIVSFLPDRLLGTYYRATKERPRSASAYHLGYDAEEARRYPRVMELTGAPPRDRPPGFGSDSRRAS